jgi:hypothetical protein
MKRILGLVFAALLLNVGVYAHGNNDHIQGVVSQISDAGITVQLANKTSKTVTLAAQTTFEKSGRPAALRDLKVGDRERQARSARGQVRTSCRQESGGRHHAPTRVTAGHPKGRACTGP